MRIHKAVIKNFRLLVNAEILFEDTTTVIVGRNNSGKTSLAELFRRLLATSSPSFGLEDFSLACYEEFWEAASLHREGQEETEIRKALPEISLSLTVEYALADADLGLLGDFIVDLDPECVHARIDMKYRLADGKMRDLFPEPLQEESEADQKQVFYRAVRDRIRTCFAVYAEAVDPADESNRKAVDAAKVRKLLSADFINAQRTLEETKASGSNVLGKIVESLFSAASGSSKDADRQMADDLREAVAKVETGIREDFSAKLDRMLPAFSIFGYPGLPDPSLSTETALDVEALLQDHTRVRYASPHGVSLPESYNGLGPRNLIYILLKLLEYFKGYTGAPEAPGVHIIFLEEPEAHLHPQMQEVFIGQLNKIAKAFADIYAGGSAWPVQFVVTTHSPHMANKAAFSAMRYFLAKPVPGMPGVCTTAIKDLKRGFKAIPKADEEFLHQYMTLTRCDLLFADKAILVEGLSERLLVPVMIEKVDAASGPTAPKLGAQYLSLVEVGGAYAHIFFPLLEFLELKTLVITDMDSVEKPGGKACAVSAGTSTSNACVKNWFANPAITPGDLLVAPSEGKVRGHIRIAYQVPETPGGACGRTLEPAFMLANRALFGIAGPEAEAEAAAHEMAGDEKKSNFALRYALQEKGWVPPTYVAEGLAWLAGEPPCEQEAAEEAAGTTEAVGSAQ